jgi:hypothetical protein
MKTIVTGGAFVYVVMKTMLIRLFDYALCKLTGKCRIR